MEITAIRLKPLRKARGLTQKQAAQQIGISIETYKRIEQGRSVFLVYKIVAIAKFFNVTMDYLLGRDISHD